MTDLYKVLGLDGSAINGGRGKWPLPVDGKPGKWTEPQTVDMCNSGWHLVDREGVIEWLTSDSVGIYLAEGRGYSQDRDTKHCFEQARLLNLVGTMDARKLRLFAADCAERVLPLFEKQYPKDDRPRKAIQAARDYAEGRIDEKARAAAWAAALAAARDAARDAALAAAWAAALAAARDAARDAALAAARDAARDAALAAARAAARAAERRWQTDRLFAYLTGEATA